MLKKFFGASIIAVNISKIIFIQKKSLFTFFRDSFVLKFRVSMTCSHAKDSPLKKKLKTFCFKKINSDGVFVY